MTEKKGLLTEKEIDIIWRRYASSKKALPLLSAIDEVNTKCRKKVEDAINKWRHRRNLYISHKDIMILKKKLGI